MKEKKHKTANQGRPITYQPHKDICQNIRMKLGFELAL